MKVTIDPYAGFCFGVERAIRTAEENIMGDITLSSLGMIVHNEQENIRLHEKGLKVIDHDNFINLEQGRVLFRAHGEPPSSYTIACGNGTKVVDATCPVVKKLQLKVAKAFKEMQKHGGLVIIYGKKGHPEVIGLMGQTKDQAMLVSSQEDIRIAILPPKIRLFAQTTMGTEDYTKIQEAVMKRLKELHKESQIDFKAFKTICGQVAGREKKIRAFSSEHELILFVAGKDSSNGRHLYRISSEINSRSYFISNSEDIHREWFKGITDVGITGATSTPSWLLEDVGKTIETW